MSLAQAFRAEFDRLRESLLAEVRRYVDERLAELGPPEQTETAGDWLTIKQVCERYSIPRSTFHEWKADPDSGLAKLCNKPGRRVLVDRAGFERWFQQRG